MENRTELAKGLVILWKEFCAYVVEAYPNYNDNDFSMDNFMTYLEESIKHTETPT